jgi:amino acid permease
MQNSLEESSKRQIKRVLIVLAVIEFIATVFVMFFVVKK